MIIFPDSRDPIFNSRDPNRVPKTPQNKPCLFVKYFPQNGMLTKYLGRENLELSLRVAQKVFANP